MGIGRTVLSGFLSRRPHDVIMVSVGEAGCAPFRVHSHTIKEVRNTSKPMTPTVSPIAVDISVMEMSADNSSGVATPDAPSVLKVPVIPLTVPNTPRAGPPSMAAPPPIIIHFIAAFI